MTNRTPLTLSIFVTTGLTTLGAAAPASADATDAVIQDLTSQGYERIEIKRTPLRLFVEAEDGERDLEMVVDRVSGAVLSSEFDDDSDDISDDDDRGYDDDSDDDSSDDDASDDDDDSDDDDASDDDASDEDDDSDDDDDDSDDDD